jgi:ankyrin repeat protein
MCGATRIDGFAFCLGVDSLIELYDVPVDLQAVIRSVTYLIKGAIFRSNSVESRSGRVSQDICPLGELIDMYYTHNATKRHDKIYALLGMSSDDLHAAGLLPNYKLPWGELLQQVVKFLLSERIYVETWDDRELAVITTKGCILGKVSKVQRDTSLDDKQRVMFMTVEDENETETETELPRPKQEGRSAHWTLELSAKSIQNGDLVCLLQGASTPTIIRSYKDYFAIIKIATTPLNGVQLPPLTRITSRDFLLVWDWGNSSENYLFLGYIDKVTPIGNPILLRSKTEQSGKVKENRTNRTWSPTKIVESSEKHRKVKYGIQGQLQGYQNVSREESSYWLGNMNGEGPLTWAAKNDYDGIVRVLLARYEIDPEIVNSLYGRTPLFWAAQNGHNVMVKLLLESGKVEVDPKDRGGLTPLCAAAQNGHKRVLQQLLDTGNVEVNSKDNEGRTPLWCAAHNGHHEVAELLIKIANVEINSKDNNGQTPLSAAAQNGQHEVVELLIKTAYVEVDAKDDKGRTPLWCAAHNGHHEVAELLIKIANAEIDSKDSNGQTPLSAAAQNGHDSLVMLQLKLGNIDVNSMDRGGRTPLWWAVWNGHNEVIKLLFTTGNIIFGLTDSLGGRTPLWVAVQKGRDALVKLLLENSYVEVDLRNKLGRTPLSIAAQDGHFAVVKLLLETGKVEVQSEDSHFQRTPMQWAARNGHNKIVTLLEKMGRKG